MIGIKLVRYIFLVLNKCTKYCQKKRNEIGAMNFFSIKQEYKKLSNKKA